MCQEELIGVLMTSICEKPASSVASLLDIKWVNNQQTDHPHLEACPYRVQTKYFTADIHLYACADPSELTDAELAQFEALVVLFDANCDNFKEKAEQLQQLRLRCCNSEVNLALCELCDNEQIKKMFAERLSEFELIESKVNADEQEECGLQRMKEALRMHTWSNLIMHDREKLPGNPRLPEHLFTAGTAPLSSYESSAGASSKPDEASVEQQCDQRTTPSPQRVTSEDNPEQDMSFEDLFAKFVSLKSQAMSMEGDERKKFAEKMVTQFWRSLGLDEEELQGLDSDSE